MKIVIDIEDCPNYGLSPNYVYKRLCDECTARLNRQYGRTLWGMATQCDAAARTLYSQVTARATNVKSLILTYSDAEKCADIYREFAETWAGMLRGNQNKEKEDKS